MIYYLWTKVASGLEGSRVSSVLQLLDQIVFRALAAAVLSFVLVLLFGRPLIAWLRRKKIGDTGLADTAHLAQVAKSKAATPTMGGILIVGSVCVSTLLLADVSNFYVLLGLVVALWLAVLGGVDDWLKLTAASRPGASRQGLFAWEKLVFQLGLGVIAGWFIYHHANPQVSPNLAHVLNLPFQRTYAKPGEVEEGLIYLSQAAFIVLAVMMLTGMSNAVNITDGMDGLAAGITSAVSLGLMIVALVAGKQSWAQYLLVPYVPDSGELAVMAAAMLGACLGFLWFNCAPAQVFMGDTGALALGGILAYIAVVTRQELVLLFMSVMFLIEIGSVTLQVGYFKATGGRRIFKVAPYHHHLHMCGWQEGQVVVRFWIVSVLLVVLGLASIKVR
ncbi:MAG: phospho-N-acetylmuramoyl-pentapeptide-transferase [Phycisphaerales bacterium]